MCGLYYDDCSPWLVTLNLILGASRYSTGFYDSWEADINLKCFHLGWCMRSTKWDKKDSQLSLILIFSIKCGLLSLGQAQPNSILRLFYFSELSRDERYWKIEGWANRFTSAIGPNSPSPSQPQLSPPPPSSLALQHTDRHKSNRHTSAYIHNNIDSTIHLS